MFPDPPQSSPPPPRWRYRFENFQRALALLGEAVGESELRPLSALEAEGLTQRFQYSWELAWKTMKDFLEHQGVVLDTVTPRSAIRAAFSSGLIAHGEGWMAALDARNRLAHTYSQSVFSQVVVDVRERYLPLLRALEATLASRLGEGEAGG